MVSCGYYLNMKKSLTLKQVIAKLPTTKTIKLTKAHIKEIARQVGELAKDYHG